MEQDQSNRSRRTSAEIKDLLESFSQSGMSAKAFCMLHSISEASYYKWRSRYANKSTSKENNFVQLHETPDIKNGAMPFAEVKGIRIYQAVSASYLKELVA